LKTLLIVAPVYSPSDAPGALRIASFVEEVKKRGWDVRVLTVDEPGEIPAEAVPLRHHPDRSLAHILQRARLARVATTFRIPDAHALWGIRAFRAGAAIARQQPVAAVVSSSLPGTAVLVGAALARRLSVPHIADFRDPWSFNPYYVWPSRLHQRLDALLERRVLREASAILCVSADMADSLADRNPSAASRIHVVPNGVERSQVMIDDPFPDAGNDFVVATSPGHYVARRQRWPYFFHGKEDDHTTGLVPLVKALARIRGTTQIRLRVLAAPEIDVEPLADHSVQVEIHERLPRGEFLRLTHDADLLYLPIVENPHIHSRGIAVPTRLYEFLATGRPLIVAASDGAAKDLSSSQPGVTLTAPGDVDALVQAIEGEIDAWHTSGRTFYPRDSVPTREEAAGDFADIVATVIGDRSGR
jgi:glycosyltransferase involved in cell wall biosynthesis